MLAKLKDYSIGQFRFLSRLAGLTRKWCHFQKPPEPVDRILPTNSGQQIDMLSNVCACAEITFL